MLRLVYLIAATLVLSSCYTEGRYVCGNSFMIHQFSNTEFLKIKLEMEDFSLFEYTDGKKSIKIYDGRQPKIDPYILNNLVRSDSHEHEMKNFINSDFEKIYDLKENKSFLLLINDNGSRVFLHLYDLKGFSDRAAVESFLSKIRKIKKKKCA